MTAPDERLEEPGESWDEVIPDEPRKVSPQVEDWVALDPRESFGERYFRGDVEIRVQLLERLPIGEPQCWLAVFQALRSPCWPNGWQAGTDWVAPGVDRDYGHEQIAMLVDDIQFVDFTQEFAVIPSAVWLYALDDCERVRMNATSYLTWPLLDLTAERIETSGMQVDGELRRGDRRIALGDYELPSEVVKRRPKTMKSVAEHQTPLRISDRRVNRVVDVIDSAFVYFSLKGIGAGIANGFGGFLQIVEVFHRSINLGEHAIQGRLVGALPTHLVLWDGDGRRTGTDGNYPFTVETLATLDPLDRPSGVSGGEAGTESGGSGSADEPPIGGGDDPPSSGDDDPPPSGGDEPPLARTGAA